MHVPTTVIAKRQIESHDENQLGQKKKRSYGNVQLSCIANSNRGTSCFFGPFANSW